MGYRINGFDQIKAFYSVVFEQEHDIKPQHISLYNFFINQNNRNNWVEWFKCPYDLAMAGACIGSKKTYYKCLNDLQEWGFIQYQKGVNDWKAPKIKIEVLKCTSTYTATVPQSKPLHIPLPTPLHIPLPEPLPTHKYKLVTSNIKHIINNIEKVVAFLNNDNNDLNKEENKFSRFNDEDYLKEIQDHLKNSLITISFEDIKTQAKIFVSEKLVSGDTNKAFYEYSSHFMNRMKLFSKNNTSPIKSSINGYLHKNTIADIEKNNIEHFRVNYRDIHKTFYHTEAEIKQFCKHRHTEVIEKKEIRAGLWKN